MVVLATGVPHQTDSPFVDVENALKPGRYRFQLTVFDEAKNESGPVELVISVAEAAPGPRFEPRIEPRLFERVDRLQPIERLQPVERQPNLAEVLRNRIPRRPGG